MGGSGVAGVVLGTAVLAAELPPGPIADPQGSQPSASVAYNAAEDEYLIGFEGDYAIALRLDPCGQVLGQIDLSTPGPNAVTDVRLAYNSDRNEYLAVWRLAEPAELHARYLGAQGIPIGEPFAIVSAPENGGGPRVAYSPSAQRYVVVWNRGFERAWSQVIDGDSGATTPQIGERLEIEPGGFSAKIAYGAGSNQFLVVFVKDFSPDPLSADVYARLLSGDGETLGPLTLLATGMADQQGPEVAYAAAEDRWLVAFAEGANVAAASWDNAGVFVDGDGSVGEPFALVATPEWDATGPLAYNAQTGTFLATWRRGSDTEPAVLAREISAMDGTPGTPLTVTDVVPAGMSAGAGVTAIAARPHSVAPQFLVTWRYGNGGSGVFAGLVELGGPCDAPEPTSTSTGDTGDTGEPPVTTGSSGGAEAGATSATGAATGGIDPTVGQERGGEDGCGCAPGKPSPPPTLAIVVLLARRRRC